MSRNGAGVYSLPAGSTVTNGDTSDSSDINTPLADLEQDANVVRPVVAGGTGASTADSALSNLGGTTVGKAVFIAASAAAARTAIGAVIGTDVQAYDADLTAMGSTGVTTAHIAAATLVTEADSIFSNDNDTTIPTSAAVKDFFDDKFGEIGPTATTSGSNVDFTGIPEGVHEIDIIFDNVGLSGTDDILVQLSVAAAFVTTGYVSAASGHTTGGNEVLSSTAGFILNTGVASDSIYGKITLNRIPGTNYWIETHTIRQATSTVGHGSGAISLAGSVDGIRLDTTGTNTFDLGRAFVRWKFLGV